MIMVNVVGNIGKDAELKTTPTGKMVCNFSVASSDRNKATTWVGCAVWGARGEKLAKYLTKGSKVAVSGSMSTREHNGKTYLEVDVSEVELCGRGQREEEQHSAREVARSRQQDNDEIPF